MTRSVSTITRNERILVGLPEDVPAVHASESWVLRQRPPTSLRMMHQVSDGDAADFARVSFAGAGVINEPVRPLVEVAVHEINHDMKRRGVLSLQEEQQIARTSRVQVPADQMSVV